MRIYAGFFGLLVRSVLRLFSFFILFGLSSCSLLHKEEQPATAELTSIISKPLPPEKTQELLGEVGDNWLYGQGMGGTIATVGTVVLFPPYALLVAGNAGLSLAGYKQIWLSDALPKEGQQAWQMAYNTVTETPGRVSAAIADEEFRTQEVAREKIMNVLQSPPSQPQNSK